MELAHNAFWPKWTVERMMKEPIMNVQLWLNLRSSFFIDNMVDYHLDFPKKPKAFLFRSFQNTFVVALNNSPMNRKVFKLYASHSRQ